MLPGCGGRYELGRSAASPQKVQRLPSSANFCQRPAGSRVGAFPQVRYAIVAPDLRLDVDACGVLSDLGDVS